MVSTSDRDRSSAAGDPSRISRDVFGDVWPAEIVSSGFSGDLMMMTHKVGKWTASLRAIHDTSGQPRDRVCAPNSESRKPQREDAKSWRYGKQTSVRTRSPRSSLTVGSCKATLILQRDSECSRQLAGLGLHASSQSFHPLSTAHPPPHGNLPWWTGYARDPRMVSWIRFHTFLERRSLARTRQKFSPNRRGMSGLSISQ